MSTAYETLLVNDEGHVRWLTLNRPARRNAMNLALAAELRAALIAAEEDPEVRVVVVSGAEGNFSAGADMQVFSDAAKGQLEGEASLLGKLDEPLAAFEKPLIACVDGVCVGMGVTLLPFFDMVYASERATFHTPFVRLGLVLEMGSSFTLSRLIGRQRANELLLRAVPLDARTAEAWGLVTRVFAFDALEAETRKIANDVAKGGPESVAACKRLVIEGQTGERAEATQRELETLSHRYQSREHHEAIAAFFARRRKAR